MTDPLVPADVDLSAFPAFLLNVDKVLSSELVALATPEEGWAAFLLWCRAWKQTPPGSLPNDDRTLAAFSGAGRRWPKVKAMALRNFVLCADGRLYHSTLAVVANEAWASRQEHDKKRNIDAERLRKWRERNAGETTPETPHETHFETPPETRFTTDTETPGETPSPRARGHALNRSEVKRSEEVQEHSSEPIEPVAAASPLAPSTTKKPNGSHGPRATRLPPEWRLPEEWKQWAIDAHHLDPQRVVRMSLEFRDYWVAVPGAKGCKLDWEATWRNSVRMKLGDA